MGDNSSVQNDSGGGDTPVAVGVGSDLLELLTDIAVECFSLVAIDPIIGIDK